MKRINLIASALLMLSASVSSFAQWQTKGFTFQGNARQYMVYKPANYNAAVPASMVLTLHGLGDNMNNFTGIGMNQVADTANIIVVVPQAMNDPLAGTAWNSGAGYSGYYPNSSVDDVAFISALIDTVKAHYTINQNRVYACGFSMGGFMTQRLAIFLNSKIASFASVSGTFGFGLPSYNPNKKISIAHFHGTADGTVPYAGNTSGIGADSLVKFWVANNQCNPVPQQTSLPNTQNDGFTVDHYKYTGGQNNTEVEFFKVNGAGHVWLTAANDISYTVEIWKFFNRHKAAIPTGVNELAANNTLGVYPNPVSDKLTLTISGNEPDNTYNYTVCDISGKHLAAGAVAFEQGSASLNVAELGLKPGLYFIQLNGSGRQLLTQKVIVR